MSSRGLTDTNNWVATGEGWVYHLHRQNLVLCRSYTGGGGGSRACCCTTFHGLHVPSPLFFLQHLIWFLIKMSFLKSTQILRPLQYKHNVIAKQETWRTTIWSSSSLNQNQIKPYLIIFHVCFSIIPYEEILCIHFNQDSYPAWLHGRQLPPCVYVNIAMVTDQKTETNIWISMHDPQWGWERYALNWGSHITLPWFWSIKEEYNSREWLHSQA